MPGRVPKAAGRGPAGGRVLLRTWLLLTACVAVSACAINPRVDLAKVRSNPVPLVIESVPFYAQTEHQCGPAALAGVLGSSGIEITPEQLSPQVYLPERQGSLQIELLAATRRAGRIAYVVDPDLSALVAELAAGRPVLVFQNLGTRHFPVWHYAVLVGIDPAANKVYLNSGKDHLKAVRAGTFLRSWEWGDRWAMIALEPGELPESPAPLHYFRAVEAFDRVAGGDAALQAWYAAAREWPEDYRPHLALGNLAYKAGDHAGAVLQFSKGLELRPDEAVLENNLAEALAAAGCPRAAEERLAAYVKNLEEDSPWRQDIAATLSELSTRRGEDGPACSGLLEPG